MDDQNNQNNQNTTVIETVGTLVALGPRQFLIDGKTYELTCARITLPKGKTWPAEDFATLPELEADRARAVAMAWQNSEGDGLRDEAAFGENGFLKIVY